MDINYERLLKSIKDHEGYRLEPYKDSEGLWTVGTGHLIDEEFKRTFCNPDNHARWFDEDVMNATLIAKSYADDMWPRLTEAQREVLIEMGFQLGNRIFKFRNMLSAIIDEDPVRVCDEMRDSLWYRQTTNRVEDLIKKWGMD